MPECDGGCKQPCDRHEDRANYGRQSCVTCRNTWLFVHGHQKLNQDSLRKLELSLLLREIVATCWLNWIVRHFSFDGEPQAQAKPGDDACGLP